MSSSGPIRSGCEATVGPWRNVERAGIGVQRQIAKGGKVPEIWPPEFTETSRVPVEAGGTEPSGTGSKPVAITCSIRETARWVAARERNLFEETRLVFSYHPLFCEWPFPLPNARASQHANKSSPGPL